MEALLRSYEATVEAVQGEERTVKSIVNTASIDRYKTVISPGGIDLTAYRKNPVVLWEHGKDPTRGSRPIGRNVWIKQVGDTLIAKTTFGKDEYSQSIYEMYRDGLLSGWSINMLPDANSSSPPSKEEMRDRPDLAECRMVYRKGELAEYSAVAVPGNAETLTILEGRGIWIPEEIRGKKNADPSYGGKPLDDDDDEPDGVDDDEEEQAGTPDEDSLPVKKKKKRVADQAAVSEGIAAVAGMPLAKPRALRYIRKKGGKYIVYSESGKVLGKHATRGEAVNQLQAIEASKARRRKGRRIVLEDGVYRVMNDANAVMETADYDLAVECLEAIGEPWRNFERTHGTLLGDLRQEHTQMRNDIMAILDLSLNGRV